MSSITFCLAPSRGRADRIIHGLQGAALRSTAIGVLFTTSTPSASKLEDFSLRRLSPAAAASAEPIRGVLAAMAGIGRVGVPGDITYIAAGFCRTLVIPARASTTEGTIEIALAELGVAPATATAYAHRIVVQGHFLISLRGIDPEEMRRARELVVELNGQDVATIGETTRSAFATAPTSSARTPSVVAPVPGAAPTIIDVADKLTHPEHLGLP